MERAEEYSFRNDVFTTLIGFFDHKTAAFFARERSLYPNDKAFFSMLMGPSNELSGKAYRNGKQTALSIESFLHEYNLILNDERAYFVFLYQDDLSSLTDSLFKSISVVDTRFTNIFKKYWRVKCQSSIKVLYYRLLITDTSSPKIEGLSVNRSHLMFEMIRSFTTIIDQYLDQCKYKTVISIVNNPVPTAESQEARIIKSENLPFLNYIYDRIVSKEYPTSAKLLNSLRNGPEDVLFYETIDKMDVILAQEELRIGRVTAKKVMELCDMMRAIFRRPGAKNVFEENDKAQLFAPYLDIYFSNESKRTYQTYQKFMESCNGSVLDFYLIVTGLSHSLVKFEGLSSSNSRILLNSFEEVLPMIDAFIAGAQPGYSVLRKRLHKLKLTEEQRNNIVIIAEKCGHFPMFKTIEYLMSNMDCREIEITKNGLNTIFGQKVQDLSVLAQIMNISRERIRQLRKNCLSDLLVYPRTIYRAGLLEDYLYTATSEYDFIQIREEEEVNFSNEYITICIAISNHELHIIGDYKEALLKTSGTTRRLYLVPSRVYNLFDFNSFICAVENMLTEKRYYPFRDDLDVFIRGQVKQSIADEDFYAILKECRLILLKGYPDNIINSQLYFPANARKTIPRLIEDIIREHNRPMTSDEIYKKLRECYPDIELNPSRIGSNALRNSNIVAVSRSSTYTLIEWNYTEKRGGTIRDIVEEYLNSLIEPIASLSDICEYVGKYRENVKESSIKANLLADTSNKFSLYYKNEKMYIGFSDSRFDESYKMQEKRKSRRSFSDSVTHLEAFIQENQRFPYSSGVGAEEIRLSRFLCTCKSNIRRGLLAPNEQAAIEQIESKYKHLKGKKERVEKRETDRWMDSLENYVTYLTINETLPPNNSENGIWYRTNKSLFDSGRLDPEKRAAFTTLVKIVTRMNNNKG